MNIKLIGQAIGLVAMTFNILSYQYKNRRTVIAFHLISSGLFTLNFLLLGAISGSILNFIGMLCALVFYNKEKLRADRPIWLWIFIATYLATYVLAFTLFGQALTVRNLIIEALPVIGSTALTRGFQMTDSKSIRRMALISSPSWLVYNIACVSIGAIVCEVFALGSILIGIFRLDRKKSMEATP